MNNVNKKIEPNQNAIVAMISPIQGIPNEEVELVNAVVAEELERIDPGEWR